MSIDYKELKKGGFMRQKQKDCFSMRLKSVGGHFTAAGAASSGTVRCRIHTSYLPAGD